MSTTLTIARGVPRVDNERAFAHRAGELAAWNALLRELRPDEWHRPTVCTEWDVADIVGHLCGQAEDVLVPWSFPVRERRARRRYPDVPLIDAHMLVQADEHRGTAPAQLAADFDRLWSKATRLIRRMPRVVHGLKVKCEGIPIPFFERMPLGYIQNVLLARDLWMHRDDVCQALGRTFDPGEHGAELVAQVMLDLEVSSSWPGLPVVLELTGPAGGRYQLGSGEPVGTVRVDAVAYMRTVSGRDDAPVVELVSGDAAAAEVVATTRMPF